MLLGKKIIIISVEREREKSRAHYSDMANIDYLLDTGYSFVYSNRALLKKKPPSEKKKHLQVSYFHYQAKNAGLGKATVHQC